MKSATALRKAKLEAPATLGTASDPDAREVHIAAGGKPSPADLGGISELGPRAARTRERAAPLDLRGTVGSFRLKLIPCRVRGREPVYRY